MLFLLYVILGEALALAMTVNYFIFYINKYRRYVHWIPFHYLFPQLVRWKRFDRLLQVCHIQFPIFEDEYLPQVIVFIQGLFSSLFLVFCIILLWDQIKNIWYDYTFVEESQARIDGLENTHTFYESWKETMGEPFCLNWFLPIEGENMNKIISDLCHQMLLENFHEKREWCCLLQTLDLASQPKRARIFSHVLAVFFISYASPVRPREIQLVGVQTRHPDLSD